MLTEDDASSAGILITKKDADNAYLGKQGNHGLADGGLAVPRGVISYDDPTHRDDWVGANANRLIIKRVSKANGAPQNGVLLEYSQGNGEWRGRLFISDNGNDGIYYGGFADGQNKGWKKLYGEGQQNRIQFANGAELWVE